MKTRCTYKKCHLMCKNVYTHRAKYAIMTSQKEGIIRKKSEKINWKKLKILEKFFENELN
jgi:hypothetical protein